MRSDRAASPEAPAPPGGAGSARQGGPLNPRASLARVAMAPDERSASSPALRFADVDLDREATPVLKGVNWQVSKGERWAVIGPNGSGKTTLVQLASGYLHPTRGTVEVLGQRLGRTDVRALRKRVSTVSASVARAIVPWLTAKEVVVSAREGALEPWWHTYSAPEWARAEELLVGCGLRQHFWAPFRRALRGRAPTGIARKGPHDRPGAPTARRALCRARHGRPGALAGAASAPLAAGHASAPIVMVTHHVEEIPEGFTHVLLLQAGSVVVPGRSPRR